MRGAVYRKIISKGEARHCKVLRIPIDSSDEFQGLEWLIACARTLGEHVAINFDGFGDGDTGLLVCGRPVCTIPMLVKVLY